MTPPPKLSPPSPHLPLCTPHLSLSPCRGALRGVILAQGLRGDGGSPPWVQDTPNTRGLGTERDVVPVLLFALRSPCVAVLNTGAARGPARGETPAAPPAMRRVCSDSLRALFSPLPSSPSPQRCARLQPSGGGGSERRILRCSLGANRVPPVPPCGAVPHHYGGVLGSAGSAALHLLRGTGCRVRCARLSPG